MLSKKLRWILILLLLLTATNGFASPWSDAIKTKIDEAVAKNFQNRTQAGVVIGVIHGDDTYIWNYGERVLGSGEPPTQDTYFEIGSITKTFTATLLALEVTRGNVRLDDQVQMFWPEIKGTDTGAITLEQLATHTSGLPRLPDNFVPADPLNPYKDYDEDRMITFLKSFKQKSPSPYPFEYSNLGIGLLGFILSNKLHDTDYGIYLREHLIKPLGLEDTKIALDSVDLLRTAQGYGSFFNPLPIWDLNVMAPAGALKATANDLLKYIRFYMQPDQSQLGRAAELAQWPRTKADSEDTMIGLAWFKTNFGKHSVVAHSGATGGYRASVIFDRENQIGYVELSNTDISPSCIHAPVFDVECSIPEWKTTDFELQQRLLGTYRADAINLTVKMISENGILGLQQDGYLMRLWPQSDTEYAIPQISAKITFKLDDQGYATQFTLQQDGAAFDFIKHK